MSEVAPGQNGQIGRLDQSARPQAPRAGYGTAFWLLFTASFALNSQVNLFVLFPLYVVELGGGAGLIGAVVGTGSLFALLARPAAGAAIDSRGPKWTALWFLFLDAGAVALYLAVRTLGWPMFAVRAIHGAVEGTARVALFAMVYDLLPDGRRGEGMAIFSLCGMGSAMLAPLAGEWLIKRVGFGAFFATSTALVLIGALAILALREDRPVPHACDSQDPDSSTYRGLLADPGLRPLWIVTLLFSLALSARLSFVAPFADARGIAGVGWYFAVYSLAAVLVRVLGGRVIDRVGPERMLMPSLLVLAVGLALIAGTGRLGILLWAAAIGGIGHGYIYPSLSALVIARTRTGAMGRCSGIYTSLYDLGGMAGPYLLGIVGEFVGYGPVFIAAAAYALVAGIYFAFVQPVSARMAVG